jgi:hypothetical protein
MAIPQSEQDGRDDDHCAPIAMAARPAGHGRDDGRDAGDPKQRSKRHPHEGHAPLALALRTLPCFRHMDEPAVPRDLVTRERDQDPRLARWADFHARIREGEGPVGPIGPLPFLGADQPQRNRIHTEAFAQCALGERLRGVAPEFRAGPSLGQHVPDLAHRRIAVDRDAPLLGAVGNFTIEPGVADVPQRRCERGADELRIRLPPGLAPDELVPLPQSGLLTCEPHHRRPAPLRAQGDRAFAQGRLGSRLGDGARDRQRRNIRSKRRRHRPGDEPAETEQRQRALERHDPSRHAVHASVLRRPILRHPAAGCHAPFFRLAGSSPHAPARSRRMPMIAMGTRPAAMTSARCAALPGASTRKTGIANSTRSNSACSRIVGTSPNRRKMSAHSTDGRNNSTKRE